MLGLILSGTLAFAANHTVVTEKNADEDERCSSTTKTVTTTRPDGTSTSTTTTNVDCDTPQELATYHKLMNIHP